MVGAEQARSWTSLCLFPVGLMQQPPAPLSRGPRPGPLLAGRGICWSACVGMRLQASDRPRRGLRTACLLRPLLWPARAALVPAITEPLCPAASGSPGVQLAEAPPPRLSQLRCQLSASFAVPQAVTALSPRSSSPWWAWACKRSPVRLLGAQSRVHGEPQVHSTTWPSVDVVPALCPAAWQSCSPLSGPPPGFTLGPAHLLAAPSSKRSLKAGSRGFPRPRVPSSMSGV